MEKYNVQKELFEELQAPKRQPRRFGRLFQRGDFSISLNAERIVFVSIGIIMLLVVFFALGVERGKAVSANLSQSMRRVTSPPAQQAAVQVKAVSPSIGTTLKEKAPVQALKNTPLRKKY
jgi:hypothetical protein